MTYIGSGFSLWDHARFEGDAEGSSSASGGGAYGQEGLNAAAASVSGTGPSPSSPAGGAQAASGGPGSTSYGPAPAGNVSYGGGTSYSGPSPSSPAGGAQAASSYGPGNDGASVGYGPSPSSPAGGAQAAAGYGPAGYGPSPAESIGYGPSPSSPAGGAQAAAGYSPSSPTGFGPSPSSPAGGAQAAAGFTPTGGLMPGLTPTGLAPTGTTMTDAYTQAANSMLAAGIGNVGGRLGLTEAFLAPVVDAIIGAESNNNPNAKNPLSTATGLGQFIASTWMEVVQRHMPELMAGRTRAEVLGLRSNPEISRALTTAYVTDNAQKLAANNITVTPASIYAAHFLGPQGAVAAYQANPSTPAVNVLGQSVVNANPSIMSGKTIGQVLGYVDNVMSQRMGRPTGVGLPSLGPVPESRPAPTVAASPQEQRMMAEYQYAGQTRSLAPANPYSPLSVASDSFLSPETLASPPTPSITSAPQTFADKYLSTPETAPVPSDRPAQPTQAATAPATPSLGGKIAAGAIDVGLGLIPGIGLGAGLFNAGAQLTGNQTIGERAVDMFQNAPGPTGEQNVAENDGAGLEQRERAGKAEGDAETETGTPAERFERTYLYVRDLPTPQQRWGRAA